MEAKVPGGSQEELDAQPEVGPLCERPLFPLLTVAVQACTHLHLAALSAGLICQATAAMQRGQVWEYWKIAVRNACK